MSTDCVPSAWLNDKEIKHDRQGRDLRVGRGDQEQTSTQMSKGNGEKVKGYEEDEQGDVKGWFPGVGHLPQQSGRATLT